MPQWLQDRQHIPHPDLNNINIKVLFWHDAVKLPLLKEVSLNSMLFISEDEKYLHMPVIGDKILIVGYPYGFSAAGSDQPTAIVLTRHVAAMRMKGMRSELLLDGPGTPGMSGSPVFVETGNKLYLQGIYTGNIFPDYKDETNIQGTTLGRYCSLGLAFTAMPFLPSNSDLSEPVTHYVPA